MEHKAKVKNKKTEERRKELSKMTKIELHGYRRSLVEFNRNLLILSFRKHYRFK